MPSTLPLRKFVAPSPNVLSFLRKQVDNAFEPCAFSRTRGYNTDARARVGKLGRGSSIRGGTEWHGRGDGLARPASRNYVSPRITNTDTIIHRPALGRSTESLFTPNSSPCPRSTPVDRRAFSTTTQKYAWGIFGAKKPQQPSQPRAYTSPLSGVMDDSGSLNSLGRHMRSANELKMRCTELDENGHVTMVSGEFKKSELTAKVCYLSLTAYRVSL
jgi:magnesium transporter